MHPDSGPYDSTVTDQFLLHAEERVSHLNMPLKTMTNSIIALINTSAQRDGARVRRSPQTANSLSRFLPLELET